MAKVKKNYLLNNLLILTFINILIGQFFSNNGDRYEGDWKDDIVNGHGKKSDLLKYLLILTLFNTL